MTYLILKWLHILAVIAWMAGMMYLPRLFIYHLGSERGGEADRTFRIMERRLLKGIINPSMVAVWVLGIALVVANPAYLSQGWLYTKIALVVALSAVHGFYVRSQKAFERGERPKTDRFWRIINEAPFVLLIGIVFLVVLRPF